MIGHSRIIDHEILEFVGQVQALNGIKTGLQQDIEHTTNPLEVLTCIFRKRPNENGEWCRKHAHICFFSVCTLGNALKLVVL